MDKLKVRIKKRMQERGDRPIPAVGGATAEGKIKEKGQGRVFLKGTIILHRIGCIKMRGALWVWDNAR